MNSREETICRRLLNEAPVEPDFHCLRRARGHTHFTSTALVPCKDDLHGGSFDEEGPCRANRCAGSALETPVFVSPDVLTDALHLDTDAFQVTDALLEIFFVTAQLHHDHPLFSRVDRGFQNVAVQVELAN